VFTFGFDKSWVSIECTDRDSCNNPYIYCSNVDLTNPYVDYELKEYCSFYNLSTCIGHNCNVSIINSGDYIGEKPPRIAKNGLNIILLIVGLTFYFNYLYYLYTKRTENESNN